MLSPITTTSQERLTSYGHTGAIIIKKTQMQLLFCSVRYPGVGSLLIEFLRNVDFTFCACAIKLIARARDIKAIDREREGAERGKLHHTH